MTITIFLITFSAFCFLLFLMAIGAMFRNKPLKGSCGGLSTLLGPCENCSTEYRKNNPEASEKSIAKNAADEFCKPKN